MPSWMPATGAERLLVVRAHCFGGRLHGWPVAEPAAQQAHRLMVADRIGRPGWPGRLEMAAGDERGRRNHRPGDAAAVSKPCHRLLPVDSGIRAPLAGRVAAGQARSDCLCARTCERSQAANSTSCRSKVSSARSLMQRRSSTHTNGRNWPMALDWPRKDSQINSCCRGHSDFWKPMGRTWNGFRCGGALPM